MLKFLPIAFLLITSVPVAAQVQQPDSPTASKNGDLDRMVCEKEEQIGSRLGARKVCKTVKEWQEQRRVQRQDVERVQQNINQNQPGGGTRIAVGAGVARPAGGRARAPHSC
jgi:hypothetical protein